MSTRSASNCFPTCMENVYYLSYICHACKLLVTNLKVTNGIIKSQCWRIKEKAVAMLFFLQNTKSANRAARVVLLGAKIL